MRVQRMPITAAGIKVRVPCAVCRVCKLNQKFALLSLCLYELCSAIRTREFHLIQLQKAEQSQLTRFVLLPRQGPLTLRMWLRQTRSLCCVPPFVIVLICMLPKTALIMCSSQGKARHRSVAFPHNAFHLPPMEMIFLLVIHGIFLCNCSITFIYSPSAPSPSLCGSLCSFGCSCLCKIKCTPSGVLSHDKNHKAFQMSLFICCTSSQATQRIAMPRLDFQQLLKCLHRCA